MLAGFRAAYEPYEPPDPGVAETRAPDGRRGTGTRTPVGRAVAGAALSVGGVVLGIATLLWVTDDRSARPEPPAQAPASRQQAVEPEPTAPVAQAPVPPPAPAPAPSAAVTAAPRPAVALAPAPAVVPVTVLNNSRTAGLAARGAEQFRAGGWPVAATGNFRGRLPTTTVYYPPGQQAAAQAFAERFPTVGRVLPRFAGLPGSGLTVVLTRDFA